jgi:hypothetical protein
MPQNDDLIKSIRELFQKEVGTLNQRFDGLEHRFDGLEKRLDGLEENVRKDIKDLSENLGEVMAKAITRIEFEERLKPIEDVLDIPHSS